MIAVVGRVFPCPTSVNGDAYLHEYQRITFELSLAHASIEAQKYGKFLAYRRQNGPVDPSTNPDCSDYDNTINASK
jgi:hypothetical protein